MSKKPLYMETTEITPEKTAAEILGVLVTGGASSVSTAYEAGRIKGLTWTMKMGANELTFAMPARVEPVYKLLCSRRSGWLSNETKQRLRAQAERVAWRHLLRWVQIQIAMIEVGMVSPAEPFLPYLQREDGRTFYEYFESHTLALPPASETTQ